MKPPFESIPAVDLTDGFTPQMLKDGWGIGGYNEKRENMYTAPQYNNRRNIHMGVDIWAPVGEPVYAPLKATVAYTANHPQDGNYGGTVVLKHGTEGRTLYALYGHLSLRSLERLGPGDRVEAGTVIGWLGDRSENGNWHPHLHYQLSYRDPGEADMPGVVEEKDREKALRIYPDPAKILGELVSPR